MAPLGYFNPDLLSTINSGELCFGDTDLFPQLLLRLLVLLEKALRITIKGFA